MLRGLLSVALLAQAPTPGWPASAGPPPARAAAEYRDPGPRYDDPPPGIYRLPDGTFARVDPPPGRYDPPPGHYPVEPRAGETPALSLGPLPVSVDAEDWLERRRRLRIGLGVSAGALALAIPFTAVPIACSWGPRGDCGYEVWPIRLMVGTLFLLPATLVLTVTFGALLGVHHRRRPGRESRLSSTPGGLVLRF